MQTLTYIIGVDRRGLVKDIQNFKIDFTGTNYNWVQARQYENSMRQVFVNVKNEDGSPYDLTGCNIWFQGKLPDNTHRIIDAKHGVMIDPTNGQFRFDMPAQAFAVAGSYVQAFFRIMRNGNNLATLEFNLEVLADTVISGLIPADYITPFEDLYDQLAAKLTQADTDAKTVIAEFTDKFTALFKQLSDQGTDTATMLTTLEQKIKADGLMTQADLDTALKKFTNDFADLTDKVTKALGDFQDGNALSGYFEDEVDEVGGPIPSYALARLNQLTGIPASNLNIGFITDNHHQLSSYSPHSINHYVYMAAASRRARLDAVVAGGDNTNGWYSKQEKLVETRQATSVLANRVKPGTDVYYVFGNHDNGIGQNGNNTPATCLSDAEIKAYYRTADKVYGETRDGDSLYGYKDYSDKKVRLIWLNSFDLPYTLNSDGTYKYDFLHQSGYQNQQLTWLANQALKVPDNSWQVMIFTHCPLPGTFEVAAGQAQLSQYNSDVLVGIINAFQSGTKYSLADASRTLPINVTCDYTSQDKSVVIGLFSGHIHRDGQMTYDGINCVETAASLCFSGDAGRTKDTITEDCWDIFSVDTTSRKIHAYRFGYGSDRDFTY